MKEMGTMFKWFKEGDYEADIQKLRNMHPDLIDSGGHLEKDSTFVRK
jgi:hypothetical protein